MADKTAPETTEDAKPDMVSVAFKIDRKTWNKVVDATFAMNRSRTNAQSALTVVTEFAAGL